jgi:hypothetical protein
MAAPTLKCTITESDDATSFDFLETTGVYNNPLNLGGWGAPNFTIASALTAPITLSQLIDAGTGLYTPSVTVSEYPTLPNTTNVPVNLTAAQFGYGTGAKFPDAVYKIIYAPTSSSGAITPLTSYVGFYSNMDCAIKKLSDSVAICTCNCDGIEGNLRSIQFYRNLLTIATSNVNIVQMAKYVELITKMLADCGCNC